MEKRSKKNAPPMQHGIDAIFILDKNGERVLAKYFDNEFIHVEGESEMGQQYKFEQNMFERMRKNLHLNGDSIERMELGNEFEAHQRRLICLCRREEDMHFFIVAENQAQGADDDGGEEWLHSLLHYIVHACTEGLVTPTQLGLSLLSAFRDQQHQKQQQQNNKRAKKQQQQNEMDVEKRASKGRRIRYVEIPELVNFFPATPECTPWTYERRDELFKSLFA